MEYFLILIGFLLAGILMTIIFKIKIYKSIKQGLITIFTVLIIGMVWDYFATSRRHWIFPGDGLLGIRIYDLPLEEFLFFLIIPFFGITLYKLIDMKMK